MIELFDVLKSESVSEIKSDALSRTIKFALFNFYSMNVRDGLFKIF